MILTPESDYDITNYFPSVSVFLGGTIDNGESVDWQEIIAADLDGDGITVLNPRRKNWDKNADSDQIRKQIIWELHAQENSDVLIYNILPDSKSPITLMEIGAFKNDDVIVNCPPEFYRYDNVKTFCEYYHIKLWNISNVEQLSLDILDYIDSREWY